jgi:small subunit ribosomal protein S18
MAEKRRVQKRRMVVKENCPFCKDKFVPVYSEVSVLQKYVTDRGKIIGRARSGICSKHQRRLTSAIKHARHLALMSFVSSE